MALGAESRSILRLILSDVLAVLLVGVTAGVGLSLAVTQLLRRMLFGLGARDAATIVGAIAILSAVALLASYLPARRAMRVDPMIALRHD
jgi:putative ABC transport system permease protein